MNFTGCYVGIISLMLSLFLLNQLPGEDQKALRHFDELLWKYRVIVIFSEDVKSLKKELTKNKIGINERHIIWFVLNKENIESNHPLEQYQDIKAYLVDQFKNYRSKVFLIGKDGKLKNTAPKLDLDTIYQKIDAMPMRIREMQSKN